jgi:hypothetical protein
MALEAGDDDNVARIEVLEDFLGGDVGNLRLGVEAVGDDAGHAAGERDGLDAERVKRHGGERRGLLLSGGEEHVHLARVRLGRDGARELDQAVGHARHGRDDHDDPVARADMLRHPRGHCADAFGIADGRAAVFLDEEGHGESR